MYKYFFKDIFDFYLAVILFIFFLPLMLLVYVVLYSLIGSPIYVQKRPGYMNKPFTIYKFKTLIDQKCKVKISSKKVFKFGTFLRKTGIDEIPQLLNILRGEMSFIGPRPLLMQYLKHKEFINHPRSKCAPGITGLAQIQKIKRNSRNKWKSQLDRDRYYYNNLSIFLDIKIFFITFIKIFLMNRKEDYLIEEPFNKKYLD
jgi:lipopolysaccharide/colanic/teichoic acid biosynthesis glycosyltransferase